MVKSSKQKQKSGGSDKQPASRPIAENRKARHRFDVLESLECGIALVGSEVKSLRDGKISLDEAYGRVRSGELWLVGLRYPGVHSGHDLEPRTEAAAQAAGASP